MLQDAYSINWNIISGWLIGIGGVFLGFLLFVFWEKRQENKRRKDIFNRIRDNLIVELHQNAEILTANIKNLKKITGPILYLIDESWSFALSSGVVQLFPDDIWPGLARIYYWVRILNPIITQRETLPLSPLRSTLGSVYTDTLTKYSNYLLANSEPLLEAINEIMEKLEAATYP